MSRAIRTRFAPSPTGYMHVGGVRTALFAWLVARSGSGQFILRIEDTDRQRHVQGADKHIIDSLNWLGLDFDEGPIYQSQRVKEGVYKRWAQKLIDEGRAYADPYSAEEVQRFREQAQASKQPFLYRNHRPDDPPIWDDTRPLRFKSDPKSHKWDDLIMGDLSTGPEVVDDFILIKSDGYPTYNFAHIVDDLEMQISHVIRGQEFLSSIPNYLNLYEALGETPPKFATVPHILNEQGNKKLSKRDGAKDILDYRKDGYLPEAMVNFLATLGWSDGTEQEVFTVSELIKKFDITKVQKGGAHFDERRLLWLNGALIRRLSVDSLYERIEEWRMENGEVRIWPESAKNYDDNYKKSVLATVQERLKYFAELPELTNFFFEDLPINMDLIDQHKQLKKCARTDLSSWLSAARQSLEQSDFSTEDLTDRLNTLLQTTNQKPSTLFSLIRIAVTWAPASPGLADTLHVLGKQKSLDRINKSLESAFNI